MNNVSRLRRKAGFNPDNAPAFVKQTVSEYLAGGGQITRCTPGAAHKTMPGSARVDGVMVTVQIGTPEAVLPYGKWVTLSSYDAAQSTAEESSVTSSYVWRDMEEELTRPWTPSAPRVFDEDF